MAKSRSPEYPAIGLQEAVEKVRTAYNGGVYRSLVSKKALAEAMGYKSLSGASLPVLSALAKYGLIEGRADDTRISDLAVSIIAHEPGAPERAKAIRAAAGKPELFVELDERSHGGKTTDAAIRSYLLTRRFIPPAADAAIRAYRETKELVEAEMAGHNADASGREEPADDIPLIEVGDLIQIEIGGALQLPRAARVRAVQEHEGRRWVFIEGSEAGVPVEQAVLEQKGKGNENPAFIPPRLPEEKQQLPPQPGMRREVFALDEGDVILTFPENLSASSFDDLEGYVSLFLKKARRRAGVPERKATFLSEGRTFEVRAVPLADRWQVRAFEGESPVTVPFAVEYREMAKRLDYDFVGDLMQRAQSEVERMISHDVAHAKWQSEKES